MDPLGQRSDIVETDDMTRWNMTQLPEYAENTNNENKAMGPFEWRNDLNKKIALWDGDMLTLNVHGIVNPTNEAMNDTTGMSGYIMEKAGPRLQNDIKQNIKHCKTGDARITESYQLLCRHIIHTVGPRYNLRYTTAAESALFSSYRNVLQLSRENSIETLAIPCIHSLTRGYPIEDGAHIAIRTIRRFLEKFGDRFDLIIFIVEDQNTKEIYTELLPLYFPRSHSEVAYSNTHLPGDIGNEDGEPIIEERQIRIMDNPTSFPEKIISPTTDEFSISDESRTHTYSFAKMHDDVDKSKIQNRNIESGMKNHEEQRYKRYVDVSV